MARNDPLIAVLPWIRLSEPVRIGRFEFITISSKTLTASDGTGIADCVDFSAEELAGFRTLVRCHVSALKAKPVDYVTLVRRPRATSRKWFIHQREEIYSLEEACRTLALSALVNYTPVDLHSPLVNATQIRPLLYRVRPLADERIAVHVVNRGRPVDAGGYRRSDVKFPCPLECEFLRTTEIYVDASFVIAIEKYKRQDRESYNKYQVAMSLFLLGSSDSETLNSDATIVLLVAALEYLLDDGSTGGTFGSKHAPKALGKLLAGFGSITVKQASRPIARHPKYHYEHARWYLHQKWIHELFELRNDVLHSRNMVQNNTWSSGENIFVAWLIFPVLLRLLLIGRVGGKLRRVDRQKLHALDPLLSSKRWYSTTQMDGPSPMEVIFDEANKRVLMEHIF